MKPIHNCLATWKVRCFVVSHHKVNDLNETNSQQGKRKDKAKVVVSHHKVNDLNETNSQHDGHTFLIDFCCESSQS